MGQDKRLRKDPKSRVTETPRKRNAFKYEPKPLTICGGASGPCITFNLSDLPVEEQERYDNMFARLKPTKAAIASIGGDKAKQERRKHYESINTL